MDSRLKLIINGDPEEVLMLLVRLKKPEVGVPFCQVISQFGDIITCRVQRKHLLEVYNSPDTFSVKAPRLIPATRYTEEEASFSPEKSDNPSRRFETPYTGKGIYSAFVDWGFDFAHANLRRPDGTTRFKCIWDQNAPYDGNKYGYGCVFSRENIDHALATNAPYTTLGYHPGRTDVFGNGMHGTHVVDIAAGTPVVGEGGVSTETMLVGVQLGNNFVNGSDLALGDSVRLNEALDFIHANTPDAPCVINMSLGSHGDSHTGKSLVELSLDNFLTQHPGYAIVQSVGNYYSAHCHLQYTLAQGETYGIEWNIPRRHLSPSEVEIWYPGEDQFSVRLIAPDGEVVADTSPFDDIQISYQNQPVGYIFHRSHEPNTGLNHIDIILDVSVLKGKWMIEITGTVVSKGAFHAYCERNDASQAKFSPHQSSPFTTTGSVCNGIHSITAGAYDHRNPSKPVVAFSSSGPTVGGQMKPDVLAPGYKIFAAKSAPSLSLVPANDLTVKSGSSMAAPHVAGSIALLFQKYLPERLPIEKTKQLFFQSLDPLLPILSAEDKVRAGNGFLNIRKLTNTKDLTMETYYLTRPVRRPQTEAEDYSEQEFHAPYLHEDCQQCGDALLESIEQGKWENEPDLLSFIYNSSSKERMNLFDVYRHFHPSYSFNYSPYEYKFIPVALPGKRFTDNPRTGDLVIMRTVLGGKNYGGVVINPQLVSDNETANVFPDKKKGVYIEVYGSGDNSKNKRSHLRIADHNYTVPDNILIVRANSHPLADASESDSEEYNEDIINTRIPGIGGIANTRVPSTGGVINPGSSIPFPSTVQAPINNIPSGNNTRPAIDPNDPNTDVRAKFSLQRMLRQGGDAAADAVGMMNAMNTGQLFGIYGDDLAIAANVARQKGTQRWLLVPPGKDAEIIRAPNRTPIMIFRDGIEKNSARIDAALRNAWHSFVAAQILIPPKTGGEIPSGNNIPNVIPAIPILNNILTGSVGKGGQNNPADVTKIQQLLNAAGIAIPITGQVDNKEGDITTLAIYHYQRMKQLPAYDGRVDANGSTFKSLLRDSQTSLQPFESASGFNDMSDASIKDNESEDDGGSPASSASTASVEQAEWTSNPHIHAHYNSAQTYKTARDKVVGWGVGNPADYIESAIGEWNANRSIHGHFNGGFEGNPHSSYLNLKRLYNAKGITDPAAYFTTNIISIIFFNRTFPGHRDLAAALAIAQTSLTTAGNLFALDRGTWSFVPRTFNNNINSLSNHALGKAVDINPDNNPHITSREEIEVIEAVCGQALARGFGAETDPNILINASFIFRQTFNDEWVGRQTSRSLLRAIRNRRRSLNRYAANGFLNLPSALITALQSAGLNWGGTWRTQKDFMHFELPNA